MEEKENRKCRFEECLAYHDGKEIHYFYGKHSGNLATKIQGMDSTEREERRKIDGSVEALKVFAKWYKENKL